LPWRFLVKHVSRGRIMKAAFKSQIASTLAIVSINAVLVTANAGPFDFKAGGADSPVSGSASAAGASDAAPSLEKCDKSFGTIAVVEPQNQVLVSLSQFQLPAPTKLLRLMIQQSNCFDIVERGAAMQNLMQERALAQSGEMQQGQNIGKGQMVAADFIMTPDVQFSESNTGGAALGAVGRAFGGFGAALGAVAGGIKERQASTTLIVSDARSGLQVASAEGSVSKADWGVGGFLGGVGAGAYTSTPQGKVVAAALLDNYNNIVKSVRKLPSLSKSTVSEASKQNAASAPKAGAYASGDVLAPKLAGVDLWSEPAKGKKPLQKLKKSDEMVFMGEEKNGFLKVQSGEAAGWVEALLVRKGQ
jgi:hypothetical protein